MKKSLLTFSILISLSLIIYPMIASAAGLVPCGGDPPEKVCTLCDLVLGFHNLTTFFLKILVVMSLAGIAISGLMYVISAGSEKMITQAKSFLKSSVIGFAVVLCAWLIVTITMWALSAKTATDPDGALGIEIKSWNEFECSGEKRGEVIPFLKASCNKKEIGECIAGRSDENLVQTGDYTATWSCSFYDEGGKKIPASTRNCSYAMAWCDASECKCLSGESTNCSADKTSWTCKTENEEIKCPK